MKKVTFKGVALGLGIGLILGLIISGLIAGAFNGTFRSIPKPDIRESEFDFALTYEVDGETKKIEGTYVCEFEGVSKALDGIGRDWNGYIKGHDGFTDYDIKTTDKGVIMVGLDICPELHILYESGALSNFDEIVNKLTWNQYIKDCTDVIWKINEGDLL